MRNPGSRQPGDLGGGWLWHLVEEEPHGLPSYPEDVGRWAQALARKVPRKASGMAVQGVVGLRLVSPEAVWWSSLSGRCGEAYCICPVKTAVASGFLQPESHQVSHCCCKAMGISAGRREPTCVGKSPLLARPCPSPSSRCLEKQREAGGPKFSAASPRTPSTAQQSHGTLDHRQEPGTQHGQGSTGSWLRVVKWML